MTETKLLIAEKWCSNLIMKNYKPGIYDKYRLYDFPEKGCRKPSE